LSLNKTVCLLHKTSTCFDSGLYYPQSIYKNQMEMQLRVLRSQILADIVIKTTYYT